MNILALTQRSVSEVIQIDDISRCRVLLETMTNNWHRRAQVTKARKRVEKTNQPEWTFDQNKADFRTICCRLKITHFFSKLQQA